MDLTGGESQNWMGRGYVESASADGNDVNLTGRVGALPDDTDRILANALADHEVNRYPGGAVIGWFPTSDIESLSLRNPEEIETDPHPFEASDDVRRSVNIE